MIKEIIELIVITSLWVWGIKISTEPNMVFDGLGEWAENKVEDGYKIFDALLVCPFCLPSLHSLIGYGFGYLFGIVTSWHDLVAYPIVVCGASLISGLIWLVYQNLLSLRNYLDSK